MIVIGEKINGGAASASAGIASFDETLVRGLAERQAAAGVDYLDLCAGGSTGKELDVMRWLIDVVQGAVETRLCIDSPDPRVIEEVMPLVRKPGIINSVSGEKGKCDAILPLLKGNEWQVIALTCDDSGVPRDRESKVAIAGRLVESAERHGVDSNRIYIDPIVMALSAFPDALDTFCGAIRDIKRLHPGVRTTSGLSNISYGMPFRKAINLNFLTLALAAGLDSAILDPTNSDTIATILATEALLGRDRFCHAYNKAYRERKIGNRKPRSEDGQRDGVRPPS